MSSKFISVPRGTADILPEDSSQWQEIEQKARHLFRNYGYREIRTPIYEETALFKRSLGQTSDVVNKQLLELVSSKEDSGYALRPEGTASVVRSYIENSFDSKESISKLFYIGPMFRGERPQKGRLRQFHQIGVEVIGAETKTPLLDAETIALAIDLLKSFGLKDYQLKMNSLGTPEDKKNFSAFLREQLTAHKKELCPDCQDRLDRNVFRVLDCKNEACKKVVAGLKLSDSHLSQESQDYFQKVKEALRALNISFTVSPDLVRGLDYYTHTVFEITSSGLGSQDAVGAGGRYNNLLAELGGEKYKDVGSVGFALGCERILLAIGGEKKEEKIDAFVIPFSPECELRAFQLLSEVRSLGLSADMGFGGGSMKSQMRQANKTGAQFVLILGEDEIKNNEVSIKNMASGNQEKIALGKIKEYFKK